MKKTVLNRYLKIGLLMNSVFVIGFIFKLIFPNPTVSKPIIITWLVFGAVALFLIVKGYLNHKLKEKHESN